MLRQEFRMKRKIGSLISKITGGQAVGYDKVDIVSKVILERVLSFTLKKYFGDDFWTHFRQNILVLGSSFWSKKYKQFFKKILLQCSIFWNKICICLFYTCICYLLILTNFFWKNCSIRPYRNRIKKNLYYSGSKTSIKIGKSKNKMALKIN